MNQSFKILMRVRERCPIKTAISHLNASAPQNVAEICGSVKSFEEKMQPDG
jgi:hypothetical protein